MAPAILLMSALLVAFLFPLVAPWRKPSLYVWLIVWFGSWLCFFYLAQLESHHYGKGATSTPVGLFISTLLAGSIIRAISRGVAVLVRRHREQPARSAASGP